MNTKWSEYSDSNTDQLVRFILKYSRFAASSKNELDRKVTEGYSKVMHGKPATPERKRRFEANFTNCHLDYLTTSDIAYTLWQYFNSYDDWFNKMKKGNPGTLKYTCQTKFTANRKEQVGGGVKNLEVDGEGSATGTKEYERCLQFAKMLKTLGEEDAKMLRWVINEKAREFGLLSGHTKSKALLAYEESEAAEGALAYKLDMDDFDELEV